MRLLHTSDWHVGRTIRERSRMDEFAAVFDEMVAIAIDASVDAVLIAGDLFDQFVPGAEAEELLYETLLRLRATGAGVVAINGNHESDHRLRAVVPLLAGNGISLVTGMPERASDAVVTIASRDGSERAAIACIPFIPPRKVTDGRQLFENLAAWPAAYAERTAVLVNGFADALPSDAARIVLAHLFASGAAMGGGEREVSVGPDYAVSASSLPSNVGYIALGHIHRHQRIAAAPAPTWYSGSPLMLDFGEERDTKSVAVVEVSARTPAKVTAVPLSAGKALVTLTGSLDQALDAGRNHPEAYLRLVVELSAPQPGLADRIRDELPNVVDVTVRYPAGPEDERPSLEALSPRERFRLYLDLQGYTEVEPLVDTFDELLAHATGGSG